MTTINTRLRRVCEWMLTRKVDRIEITIWQGGRILIQAKDALGVTSTTTATHVDFPLEDTIEDYEA